MRTIRRFASSFTPIVAIGFVTLCLLGCGGQEITLEETNKAIAQRFWQEGWKEENQSLFDELCAYDLISNDPNLPEVIDLKTYKEHVALHVAAFPAEPAVEVEDMVAQGDKLAVRWTWQVTHQGEYMGIPPTGNSLILTGMTIHRLVDGKVAENWHQYDALGFLQQLGVVPPMGREDFTWGQPVEIAPAGSSDPEANMAIYRREAEELWNAKDLDVVDQIFSSDFVNHDPAWPGVVDRETFRGWATAWLSKAPDMEIVIDDILAQEDKVIGRWTVRWTDVAGMEGVEPTGKQIKVTGMDICRIADGKIVERWWAKDILGAMQQMEVVPPLGKGEE
jgi:steroid delta-isomerase-like uncharacterized protein